MTEINIKVAERFAIDSFQSEIEGCERMVRFWSREKGRIARGLATLYRRQAEELRKRTGID